MIQVATADQPSIVCLQEVPGWALARFPVSDLASRPPLGISLGHRITSLHHGLLRGAVSGQGLAIWLGPSASLLGHHVCVVNPRRVRRRQAESLGLDRRERWAWARERRIAQVARVAVAGVTLTVANLHCTASGGDNRVPDFELMRTAEFARSIARPGDVVVIAGDFNVRPARSEALPRLRGPEWGFSAPGRGIDHILVAGCPVDGLAAWSDERRRAADGAVLSDHAPVDLHLRTG